MTELQYTERQPHPGLSPFIAAYWRLEGPAPALPAPPERVLPDGSIEAVVHLGDPFLQHGPDGRGRRQPRALLVGQLTRPFFIGPAGKVSVVGVRFRPGGLAPFRDVPAAALTGASVDLEDVGGRAGRDLVDRLAAARRFRERVELLDRFFAGRMAARPRGPGGIHPAVAALGASRGPGGCTQRESVGSMARRLGLSVRHLERVFRDQVGLSPGLFCRIRRFDAAIRRLGSPRPLPLAQLAAEAGYADQAHMTREFRRFSGITPGAYRRDRLPLSDLFTAGPPGEGAAHVASVQEPPLRRA